MKRVIIAVYSKDDDIESDVERAINALRALVRPELVSIQYDALTEEELVKALEEPDRLAL
jgi:hypothetical protein